jgi:ribosome-associated translation inhibitor RaiA
MCLGGNLTISTSTKSPRTMKTSTLCNVNQARVIAAQYLPDAIKGMIQQQIARLKQEYSDLLNCKVDVSVPAFCQTGIYQVRILLHLSHLDLKIDREPTPDYYQEDMYVAIWSAFDLASKKLKEHSISTGSAIKITPIQNIPPQSMRAVRRSQGYARG